MQFLKKECGGEGRGCCSEPVKMEFFRFACDYDEVENTIGVDVDANDVKEGSKEVIYASLNEEEFLVSPLVRTVKALNYAAFNEVDQD